MSIPRNPTHVNCGELLNQSKSAVPPPYSDPEVLSTAYDNAKLLVENFHKNSNLDDSSMFFTCFLSLLNYSETA